jgi:hypothetical protein
MLVKKKTAEWVKLGQALHEIETKQVERIIGLEGEAPLKESPIVLRPEETVQKQVPEEKAQDKIHYKMMMKEKWD